MTSPDMVAHYAKSKLGVDPKDLKVAIIHEDGPYGSGVAGGNEQGSKKHGFKIVLKEGYAATSPDLSSLVTKLKRKRPDVIFHTGYNPDISLFLRQSRELGLKWKALIGHGAGYGVPDKLYEAVGDDANFIFNVDPVSIWLIDPATLTPGLGKVTEMVGVEYKKARPKVKHSQLMLGWLQVMFTHSLMMCCLEQLKSMAALVLRRYVRRQQKQIFQSVEH